MNVIGQKGPRVHHEACDRDQSRHTLDEVFAVSVVVEDATTFNSPHHDMVEDSRGIEASAAGHDVVTIA
jgi:hypothetical protein